MVTPQPAVHRTILVVDVEGFGDQRRTNLHQVAVRDGVYGALERAFGEANIAWSSCDHEDRGDGVFILAPAAVPKSTFVESLPRALVNALQEHNKIHSAEAQIRLRMALHAGEVKYDDHGVTAAAINLTFRLLDAAPLKAALAASDGVLAIVASPWFYDEVIRHSAAADPTTYRPVPLTVKETSTVAWIGVPDQPHLVRGPSLGVTDAGMPVPHQLPAHTPHFVGRAEELRRLNVLDARGDGSAALISVINGTAGVGKTTLALQWAKQAAERFPDGQLYVNLRGFDSTGSPMDAGDAIRRFLDALEVPPQRIPVDLDAQAALYRSLLADRKVLVVLDNARDDLQVRPLLPGSATCRVVITSRNQLASLITHEGARPVNLDVLNTVEAFALLAHHLGQDRVNAETDITADLIDRCARLPLALAIVAARAALNPGLSLHAVAEELHDERTRLQALDAGDPKTSIQAVLSWSYQQLSLPAARMFRLLGGHSGPDISQMAAASLACIPLALARSALTELTRANLLVQRAPGRFAFHDLLRAYAKDQASITDPRSERADALGRLLDFYLHTAYNADRQLNAHRPTIMLAPPRSGVAPEVFTDDQHALSWFATERPVLLAVIDQAVNQGCDTHVWQLSWTMATFLDRQGHWHDYAATHHNALAAAYRLGSREGRARAHHGLGRACVQLGQSADAAMHYQQAINQYHQLGDRIGQARAHRGVGWVLVQQGRNHEALHQARLALRLYQAAGHLIGQADALSAIGMGHALLGEHRQAVACCEQALALRTQINDHRGEAETWLNLGFAHHHLGHHLRAINHYQQAIQLHREVGERHLESVTLSLLGDTYYAAGDPQTAEAAWQQARQILDDLRHPDPITPYLKSHRASS